MTTVVQRTYRPQIAKGAVGLIADETSAEVVTRQCETVLGIPFGVAVSQGTADKGVTLGGTAFLGISVRDVTLDRMPIDPLSSTETDADTYARYQNLGVLTRGHIWVEANSDVTAGASVYFDPATGLFGALSGGLASTGSIDFSSLPVAADTLVINGTTVTFSASSDSWTTPNTAFRCQIRATLGDTLVAVAAALNTLGNTTDAGYMKYQAYPPSPGGAGQGSGANKLMYSAKAAGVTTYTPTVTGTLLTTATINAMVAGTTSPQGPITGAYWLDTAVGGDLARLSLGIQR